MEKAFLGLGSSLGDRMGFIEYAADEIRNLDQVFFHSKSSVYESAPWGGQAKNSFLNNVLCIRTTLDPEDLLHQCIEIESRLGRVRTHPWEDRNIDIDILLYGEQIIYSDDLIVPHPYLAQRKFVLVPLFEMEPDLKIPGQNQSLKTLIDNCPDQCDPVKADSHVFVGEVS